MAEPASGLNGNSKFFVIMLMASLAFGGGGIYTASNSTHQVEVQAAEIQHLKQQVAELKAEQEKADEMLDEVLQREMRLITAPMDIRIAQNSDDIADRTDRINQLEREIATLQERTRP